MAFHGSPRDACQCFLAEYALDVVLSGVRSLRVVIQPGPPSVPHLSRQRMRSGTPSLHSDTLSRWFGYVLAGRTQRALAASVLVVFAIATGYPLLTGQIIPDRRGLSLPSAHVSVPGYWNIAAAY